MTKAQPPVLLELLDLVRPQIRRETLSRHVMSDPGTGDYIAAFEAVLRRGAQAIEASFDLIENLGPGVNWQHARDDDFRWFRLLTATIGLFLRGESFVLPTHQLLVSLLVDGLALDRPERPGSPHPGAALIRLCREFPPHLEDPREGAAFLLGELILLGARGTEATVEDVVERCAALERVAAACEQYYLPGDEWEPNPWFAASALGPWGWARETQLHAVWVGLVADHFPTEPAAARAMKQRLVEDGARWAAKRRRLS
jgi:hypothetical protein